jgi:hypothetical protein
MTRRSRTRTELLAAYRDGTGPPRAVEDALWSRLELERSPTAMDAGCSQRAGPRASPSRRRDAVAVALVVAALVVAWLVGAPREALDSTGDRDAVSLSADARMQRRDPTDPAVVRDIPRPRPESRPPDEPAQTSDAAAVVEPPKPDHRPSKAARPPRPIAPTSEPARVDPRPSDLAEETAIIERARATLHQGSAERALAILADYERRFETGALAEEAQGLQAIARCAVDPGSVQAAEQFVSRYPSSMFRRRVEASCIAGRSGTND